MLEIEPPETRYWSVTMENIWHECIDARRRHSSITNAAARCRRRRQGADRGRAGRSQESSNWLDTGGRHRGFVIIRWLDNPDAAGGTTGSLRWPRSHR